jgi:very-short-patch-repair endonuclease
LSYRYIVDFVCFEQRLIVEADGSQHSDGRRGARRAESRLGQGFRLLRFWNNQILAEGDNVAGAVFAALFPSHPAGCVAAGCPSPARGEGLEQKNG